MTASYARAVQAGKISTHTSLAGRDADIFQEISKISISTHTSLAGRDSPGYAVDTLDTNFYSHVPRGT